MSILRQILLGMAVLAVTIYIWIQHVPQAMPFLDRIGVLSVIGIDVGRSQTAEDPGPSQRDRGPVQVIVAQVQAQPRTDDVTAIGDGRARHSVTVRSETLGRITRIGPSAGDSVSAGEVLVQLEDEAETIALEQAQITLDDALAEAARVKQLEQTGAVTEVRVREVELALRTAELDLRQAQFDLDQRRIRAPIAGQVGIIDVEVGDQIDAQQALMSITDRSDILIDFRVPERVIGETTVGMAIAVMPLGLRDLVLTGEISAIDTVVDRASRTLRVQARVDNSADLLRVGMAFQVTLRLPGETMLSVDPLAVQWSSAGAFVWAIRLGKAERVPVTIRQRNSDQVLVDGALDPGESIVTHGVQSLRPGSEVAVRDESAAQRVALPTAKL